METHILESVSLKLLKDAKFHSNLKSHSEYLPESFLSLMLLMNAFACLLFQFINKNKTVINEEAREEV